LRHGVHQLYSRVKTAITQYHNKLKTITTVKPHYAYTTMNIKRTTASQYIIYNKRVSP